MVDNIRDTAPDKITYKLPNGGGSGYFHDRFLPLLTMPRNNDKVEYAGDMTITDENGIKYLFNGAKEKTGDYTTRWMCSSIWSPRNRTSALVSFEYRTASNLTNPNDFYNLNNKLILNEKQLSGGSNTILTEQMPYITKHYLISKSMGSSEAKLTEILESEAKVAYPKIDQFTTGYVSAAWLQKVNFLGNKLSVSYKTVGSSPHNSDVIDEITVADENGKIVRNIKFYIATYNGSTSLTKLDSVRISAPEVEPRTYSFRYWSEYNVPSINTTAVDHWGFCNGLESTGQRTTVPGFRIKMTLPNAYTGRRDTILLNHSGMNREPDHTYTKVGILNRITDPQGIETNFFYEGNFAAFRDNSKSGNQKNYLHPVGGLRIERIETADPKIFGTMVKSYKYGLTKYGLPDYEPVWGGGAVKHIVTERDYSSSVVRIARDPYNTSSWDEYLTTYNSMPVSNIRFNGGSAVMYNIVSEEVRGYDGLVLKTNYHYYVNTHYFEDILKWKDNDPAGSVRTFLMEQPARVLGMIVRRFPAHPQEPSDDFLKGNGTTIQLYGALKRTEYFRGDELASSTDYEYTESLPGGSNVTVDFPVRLLIVDLDFYMTKPSSLAGRPMFLTGNYASAGAAQTTYFLDNRIYRVLDKETVTEYQTVGTERYAVTTQKKYSYKFDYYNPQVSIKPRKIETLNSNGTNMMDSLDYLFDYPGILSYHKHREKNNWQESRILFRSGGCLPEKVQSKTNLMPVFRDEVVYKSYDMNNNAAEIAGKDGTPVFFIWGYRNQFPIAKVENASRAQVCAALGYAETEHSIFATWAGAAAPTTDMWAQINSLRSKLPRARVTTYAYKPLQGVVSVTDPNNFITKFEYDSYSRLTDGYYLDPEARKVVLQKYIYNFGK